MSALGEPAGAITSGSREILSYPEGKVTLNQNLLVSATFDLDAVAQDRTAAQNGETPTVLPANVRKAQGTITITKGRELGWFGDLEEAKAQAETQNKQLLVLFTGTPAAPWNSVFTRTVVYNPALTQTLQQTFVLVRLTCPTESAVDAGDASAETAKTLAEFRRRTIGGTSFPALAIVTADGRRAAEVDLDGADEAQGRMAAFVKDAIEATKEKPLRARGGVSGTFVLAALAGLVVLAWLLKH